MVWPAAGSSGETDVRIPATAGGTRPKAALIRREIGRSAGASRARIGQATHRTRHHRPSLCVAGTRLLVRDTARSRRHSPPRTPRRALLDTRIPRSTSPSPARRSGRPRPTELASSFRAEATFKQAFISRRLPAKACGWCGCRCRQHRCSQRHRPQYPREGRSERPRSGRRPHRTHQLHLRMC